VTDKKETLIQWLRDAHAMEEQAETMLNAQAARLENYPDLKAQIEEHIRETQGHAQLVEGCIERLGSDTSSLKDTAGKFTAAMQGLSGMFAGDEVVKGAIASYTFEYFEIGAYTALIAAAKEAGDPQTAETCSAILEEEQSMADWLEEQLPQITKKYLSLEEAGAQAKR
jgi:ferritin-like metal-binding protein YciE